MSTSPVDDTLSASWWPELLSVKDTLSWAALSAKFGPSANTLRSALAAAGQSKAPMAPGRKPKNGAGASSPASSPARSSKAAKPAAVAKAAPTKASAKAAPTKASVKVASAKAAPANAAPANAAPANAAPANAAPAKASATTASAPVAASVDALAAFREKLGAAPDADVASLAGVSTDDVKAYRRAHDIPAFRRPPPSRAGRSAEAPAASVAPRGKASDADQVVRRRRASSDGAMNEVLVRTPAPERASERAPERAPERVAASAAPVGAASNPLEAFRDQLGKVADHIIADQANVDRTVVGAWRRKLGVPAYDGFRKRKSGMGAVASAPKAQKAAAAAPVASRQAAAKASPTPAAKGKPGRRSAIDAFSDIVGKSTDAEVAAKANVSVPAVTQYRIRRGIPAAGRSSAAKAAVPVSTPPAVEAASVTAQSAQADAGKEVRHRRSKLDAHAHLVGVLSDSEVALLANVSSEGVRQYRRRHGIPAAGGRSQEEGVSAPAAAAVSAPAPVASAPAGGTNVAYRVVAHHGDESRRFVAVGVDIREALGRAVTALDARADGPWVIQSVRRLCDALG